MGTMNVELEQQYRKHLMIISSILLVYSASGGEIGNGLNFSGMNISFKNSQYLDWMVFIALQFFWWRHWQISSFVREKMWQDIESEKVLSERTVLLIMKSLLPQSIIEGERTRPYATTMNGSKTKYVLFFGEGRTSLCELRYKKLLPVEIYFGSTTVLMINSLQSEFSLTKDSIYKIGSIGVFLSLLIDVSRVFVIKAIRNPEFGDGVLPSITAGLATIAFFCNKI
jgi:hypothetical protein